MDLRITMGAKVIIYKNVIIIDFGAVDIHLVRWNIVTVAASSAVRRFGSVR